MTKKQRAAVKKMQAGLRRWKAAKRRKSAPRRRKRRRAIAPATPKRRRRRTSMAKARVANPRKRRRRSRRRAAARRTVSRVSPPKRRRRRSRRRNPGMGGGGIVGALKTSAKALVPAAIAGGAMGFIDAKLLADKPTLIRVAAKIGGAAAAGMLLRRNPNAAYAAMGAMLGSLGYEGGIRIGGGVLATSKPAGMRELAAMAAEDDEALGILEAEMQGMGLLEEDMGDADEPDLGDADEPDLGDIADDEDFGDSDDYEDAA